jgi:hypothetical protein
MYRIECITKFKQTKIQKSRFGNSIWKFDVIHDALNVIYYKNLKRPRKFGDIGFFGDMDTERILAKNREIA